ncbi:MAG: right-handed parallel beta-helix repeat-containing protein, partial [Elusimicrobiota bacterium]
MSNSSANVKMITASAIDSDYNDWFSSNALNTFIWNNKSYATLAAWKAAGEDANSISANPLWYDARFGVEDFHPLSTAGRFHPATGLFTPVDAAQSPTIDAADPLEPSDLEPFPNGSLANQGSYGDTAEASLSIHGAYHWIGVIDTTWTVPGNWTPAGPPAAGDTAIIDGNRTYQPTIYNPATVYEIYMSTGLVYGSTLTLRAALTVANQMIMDNRAVLSSSHTAQNVLAKLTIRAGAMATHEPNAAARATLLNLNVTGDLELQAGAAIWATGKGYNGGTAPKGAGSGPGGGRHPDWGAGGGGHGAGGGNGYQDAPGGAGGSYDSLTAPWDLGSGGAGGDSYAGGAGGGAVLLSVGGTFTINGNIYADGVTAANGGTWGGGGGAGGTVNIAAATLAGSGEIHAQAGSSGCGNGGGGGGGGRIAVAVSVADNFTGIYNTDPGTGWCQGLNGGTGTLATKKPGQTSHFIQVNSLSVLPATSTFINTGEAISTFSASNSWPVSTGTFAISSMTLLSGATFTALNAFTVSSLTVNSAGLFIASGTVTVSSLTMLSGANFIDAGQLYIPSLILSSGTTFTFSTTTAANFGNVTMRSSSLLTHAFNETYRSYIASMSVSGNFDLQAGATISVTGRGYQGSTVWNTPGSGPGGGRNPGGAGAGGGGHGGTGADGINSPTGGGAGYDNLTAPSDLGSGGGAYNSTNSGGAGGGAVFISVGGAFTLDGKIYANGANGNGSATWAGGAGGGSGGAVVLNAGTFSGSGVVWALGGDSGCGATWGGSGGGGGRIAVFGSTAAFSGGIAAWGGSGWCGGNDAAAGTIFIRPPAMTGNLIIDNYDRVSLSTTVVLAGDYTFDSVQALGTSSATFAYFSTVTIRGASAFFTGDYKSTATVLGNVYGGTITASGANFVNAQWGPAGNPTGINYTAQIAKTSDYLTIEQSSATRNRWATFNGLAGGATYFVRVHADGYAVLNANYVLIGGTVTMPGGWPAPPGCGQVRNVIQNGSGDHLTIQAAVDFLPKPRPTTTCIVVRDTQTYNEQVTVAGGFTFTYSTDTIRIMSDPSFISSAPVVNPPVKSTAAFQVANSSVSLEHLTIITTNTVAYGVLISSALVRLSSMSVDAGGHIATAGIRLSTWSHLSYSSITVQNANAIQIIGSSGTTIAFSSAQAGSGSAIYLNGASSNTFSVFFASSTGNHGVDIYTGSNYNSLGWGNVFGNIDVALNIYQSSANTISDSYIRNPGSSYAAYLDASADHNLIVHSTLTINANAVSALYIRNSASNTVSGSYIYSRSAASGMYIENSSYNFITNSSMTIDGNGGYAGLSLDANSRSNTIFQSLFNATQSYGVMLYGSSNTISQSTMTGANFGLHIKGSSNTVSASFMWGGANPGAQIESSGSNLIKDSTIIGAVSINSGLLIYKASSNTIDNCIIFGTGYGLYLDTASSNTITNSTMTAGVRAAVLLNSSTNTIAGSYIQAPLVAVDIQASTNTTIRSNVLISTANTAGSSYGVWMRMGSRDLELSGNTIQAVAQGRGIWLDANNSGRIMVSSNTLPPSAQYGMYLSNQAAGAQVWVTSNTIQVATSPVRDTYGIYLNSLASGATIYNNGIYYRTAGDISPRTAYGLYASNSSGINFHHNRINNPGMITAGSAVSAYFTGSTQIEFDFNDVNSTGTGLSTAYLLQLAGSTA